MVPRAGELVSRSEPAAEEGSAGVEWEMGLGLPFLRRMESLFLGPLLDSRYTSWQGPGETEKGVWFAWLNQMHTSQWEGGASWSSQGSGELI